MTPEDRRFAREALIKQLLTLDQVTAIKEECDRTRRPFDKLATERGLLSAEQVEELGPVRRRPSRFAVLLVGLSLALVVLVMLSVRVVLRRLGRSDQVMSESLRARGDADKLYHTVRLDYERKTLAERAGEAKISLEKARAAMTLAEERLRAAPAELDLSTQLMDATLAFNVYLEAHPDDTNVLVERARAYELRKNYEKAVKDLERAIALRRDLEPTLRDRLGELRLKLPAKEGR